MSICISQQCPISLPGKNCIPLPFHEKKTKQISLTVVGIRTVKHVTNCICSMWWTWQFISQGQDMNINIFAFLCPHREGDCSYNSYLLYSLSSPFFSSLLLYPFKTFHHKWHGYYVLQTKWMNVKNDITNAHTSLIPCLLLDFSIYFFWAIRKNIMMEVWLSFSQLS